MTSNSLFLSRSFILYLCSHELRIRRIQSNYEITHLSMASSPWAVKSRVWSWGTPSWRAGLRYREWPSPLTQRARRTPAGLCRTRRTSAKVLLHRGISNLRYSARLRAEPRQTRQAVVIDGETNRSKEKRKERDEERRASTAANRRSFRIRDKFKFSRHFRTFCTFLVMRIFAIPILKFFADTTSITVFLEIVGKFSTQFLRSFRSYKRYRWAYKRRKN